MGISLNPVVGGRSMEVNSIRGLFPKDNAEWLNWISQNKMLYADKEKIQTLIAQQRINLADVDYLDLDSVTNIVKNFENPAESADLLYRNGEDVALGLADRYQKRVTSKAGEAAEAYQDNMRSVRILQEEIAKETGRPIADFENAYDRENHENSINKIEQEQYIRDIMKPTEKVLAKIQLRKWENGEFITFDEIEKYLIAKHGLERNVSIGSPQRYPMFSRK